MSPVTSAPRGRPREARCDEAILRATLEMIVEGGAGAMSVEGVAARAGVGKATIYRRWTSKEALLLDAISADAAMIETPDTGALRTDLDRYFDGLIQRFRESEGSDVLPHLIEAACYDAEVRASLDRYISSRQQPLRTILQRAVQRRELPRSTDIAVLVDVLVGPLMYRRLVTGSRIDRSYVRKLLELVIPSHASAAAQRS